MPLHMSRSRGNIHRRGKGYQEFDDVQVETVLKEALNETNSFPLDSNKDANYAERSSSQNVRTVFAVGP